MSVDRRRLARAIATAIFALIMASGIIYLGRDSGAPRQDEFMPVSDTAMRTETAQPDDSTRQKPKKKKKAKTPRKPAERNYLDEPVNR